MLNLASVLSSLVLAALAAFCTMQFVKRIERQSHELRKEQHRMLADLAHNLQTPLTVLRGKVEQFEQSLLHEGHTTGLQYSVDTLTRFIQDVLAYTCVEEKLGTEKELFSLTNLVREVYEEIVDIAETENILLTVDLQSSVQIYGNEALIRDAIMNVVCNAIKYMGSSSIRRILLSLQVSAGEALIHVSDTGMGIPKSDLPHIFERFYRGSNRLYGSIQGTGIGLSIVDRVVRDHGGKVTVTSEVGKGSTFTLSFPEATPQHLRNQWLSL